MGYMHTKSLLCLPMSQIVTAGPQRVSTKEQYRWGQSDAWKGVWALGDDITSSLDTWCLKGSPSLL